MKIVKRVDKTNPPKWHAQCTCGHCESVLDVEEEDLKHLNPEDMGGHDLFNEAVFRCPACDKWNSIPQPDISNQVKDRLPTIEWSEIDGGFRSCRVDVQYDIEES